IPVDTPGLNQGHVGKRMRVALADGELLEIRLHELTVCFKPEPCCGITYALISTNRSDGKRDNGAETIFEGAHARRLRPHSLLRLALSPRRKTKSGIRLEFSAL